MFLIELYDAHGTWISVMGLAEKFWFWFSKWQCPPKDVVPYGSHSEQRWQNVQCGSSA